MKNIDYVTKKVAKELQLNEDIVSKIYYDFYWKNVVFPKIKSFEYTAITLPKLGTLYLSYYKLRKEITDIIFRLRRVRDNDTLTDGKRKQLDDHYVNYLRKLLLRRN
jgi:hypothetical protein